MLFTVSSVFSMALTVDKFSKMLKFVKNSLIKAAYYKLENI